MDENHFEPAHKDMARHAIAGILNSGMLQVVKILCQIGSVVIVARLLLPTDFGVFGMVGPIYGFVLLFQELGLSQATVQKASLNHDEVNAMFWINVAIGLTLSILLVVFSPVVGWFYHDPRLIPLTIAMGFFVLVGALGNQHYAVMRRRMQFGALALIDAAATIGSLIVSIIAALLLKNYWAIYWGMVAGTIIPVIGVWTASRWRPSFPRRTSGLRNMLKFGAGVTSFNFTNFLVGNLDSILIGHTWGSQALGLYDRAYKLLLFPLQRFAWPMGGVMVPILSRLIEEPDRYRRASLKSLSQITLGTWPGIIWALVLGNTLIPTMLGANWEGAVPIFRPLAIAALMQIIVTPTSWLFLSQGRSGEYARWGIFCAVTSIISYFIGLPYGAIGVATAYGAIEFLRAPLVWWYVTRKGPIPARDVVRSLVLHIVSGSITALALAGFSYAMGTTSPWLLLIGGAFLAYGVTAAVMMLSPDGRETLIQTFLFARKSFFHIILRRAHKESILNSTENRDR